MTAYKVTMIIEDCNNANDAAMWAREAPGKVVKVTKIGKTRKPTRCFIKVDGEYIRDYRASATEADDPTTWMTKKAAKEHVRFRRQMDKLAGIYRSYEIIET